MACVAVDREAATAGRHPIGEAGESGALLGDGASDAVVDHGDDEPAVLVDSAELDLGGPGVLDGVGEPFAGGEVGGGSTSVG